MIRTHKKGKQLTTIGEEIRRVRRLKGYTQPALCEAYGFSLSTLQRIESGRFMAYFETLAPILAALEVVVVCQSDGNVKLVEKES